ncbi:hypothetical protein SAMN05216482_5782 [Streptomyces sp. PAN_FS17]|nr:hypothetical protein SAMN05216482_5782 [Streptomyces sp. PAN_FS17]
MMMAITQKERPPASRQPAVPNPPVILAMNDCFPKGGGCGGGVIGAGAVWGDGSDWAAGGAECGGLSIRVSAFDSSRLHTTGGRSGTRPPGGSMMLCRSQLPVVGCGSRLNR